jgi:hypothetical protein
MPAHPSAVLGTAVHAIIAKYLREGYFDFVTDERAASIALVALDHAPQPLTAGMLVEQHFVIDDYHGYKDVYLPGTDPWVIDWKTTAGFGWAKDADALAIDIQACIYAYHAMQHCHTNHCHIRWCYLRTKGKPQAMPIDVQLAREQIAPTMRRIADSAQLIALARNVPTLDLPPYIAGCRAFGGCPYRSLCNLTPEEEMGAMMTQSIDDFKAQLMGQLTGQQQPQPQPQPQAAPWAQPQPQPQPQPQAPPQPQTQAAPWAQPQPQTQAAGTSGRTMGASAGASGRTTSAIRLVGRTR